MARGRYSQEQAVRDFKRRVRRNRRRRRITLFVLFCITFYCIVFLAPFFKISENSIQIIGADKTLVQVKNYSRTLIGKNINWYTTDKMEETLVSSYSYIESVDISRHFPNRLKINVKEIVPACQAEQGGVYYLLDERAKVIDNSGESFSLPEILGLENIELKVGSFISEEILRGNFVAISTQARANGLQERISKYDLTDEKNIRFKIDNIEVQIGEANHMEYKFMMLTEILEQLLPNVHGELDLRNGSKAYFREIYN